MKTTVDVGGKKQVPPLRVAQGRNDKEMCGKMGRNDKRMGGLENVTIPERQNWARVSATAGAAAWAGIAVLARMGILRLGEIELLFLLAPLVIVPLGMELGRGIGGSSWFEETARRLQPLGAVLAVVAMCLAPGKKAGVAAVGWMVVCVFMAGGGLMRLVRALRFDAGKSARATLATLGVAQFDLAVGGAWLVASRLGMRPMGIQEPIGLLTAVHFHFAGFATATIAAATLEFAERRGIHRWLRQLVLVVVVLPFLVAAGFVISPALKMFAALLFSVSVAGLAISVQACGKRAHERTARVMLQTAAGAVFAGMVLAGTYAVADFLGSDALTIPQMARTHGILNAIGFCLLGSLGWLAEKSRMEI